MRLIDADALIEAIKTDIMGGLNYEWFINSAPSIEAVREWIPCEDRLPSKSGTYLVTYEWVGQSGTKYTEIEVIDFERGRWSDHTRHYEKVTAWMPLPKPYAECKEAESQTDCPWR